MYVFCKQVFYDNIKLNLIRKNYEFTENESYIAVLSYFNYFFKDVFFIFSFYLNDTIFPLLFFLILIILPL